MKVWRALRALHAAHERETKTLRSSGRAAIGAALQALSTTAYANSEHAWRTRKGPMALYHQSIAIVAKRAARTLTRAERTGRTSRRMLRERAAKRGHDRHCTLSFPGAVHEANAATRSGSVELNEKWRQIFAGIKDEDLSSVCAALRAVHRDEGGGLTTAAIARAVSSRRVRVRRTHATRSDNGAQGAAEAHHKTSRTAAEE